MNDLGTLGGEMSGGYGINNAGQVVGWSQTSTGQHHAFLYSDGKMQDIGPLTTSNGSSAEARDINDNGLIVGYLSDNINERAVRWENGILYDLNVPSNHSIANSVSNTNYVAGSFYTMTNYQHGFLWLNGSTTDIGTLSNTDSTDALSVNDAGVVVGSSYKVGQPNTNVTAIIYQNGKIQDLNSLIPANSGWVLARAVSINNKGQILVGGSLNGQPHFAILTPTK